MKNIIICFYTIFLLLFSVFSHVFIDPNLIYLKDIYSGFAFDYRFIVTLLYVLFVSVLFIFYGVFIWLGVKKQLKFKDVFILASITIGSLIFSYPAMLSYDIFNYIITSKVLFHYVENPYIIMPVEFIGDPLLLFTHAANKIALYGPFWVLLTGIPYMLGLGNFVITLLSFKIFIAIFYMAITIFIWRMSKNIMPVILFSLNPLVVIETLISGHNDIVMVFFALLSFFILTKKKIFLAIILFVLSILIKYATLLLIPVFLYILWKVIKKKIIDWRLVFYFSALTMYVGFLLSPIREEIYPWYSIWFLSFAFLTPDKKILFYTSIAFSFSLLFRYTPYMFTGTYSGQTPVIKEIISFTLPVLVSIYYVIKNVIKKKI